MQVEGQHDDSLLLLMATGARVSNAYPTCPCPSDNPSKGGLTRYAVLRRHLTRTKCEGEGWGCVWLACWRGNGPPRRRSVGVLRGRSPHIGTETRSKLLREAAVRNIGQWARAWTSQVACRMTALWVVNCFCAGITPSTCWRSAGTARIRTG